MSWVKDDYIKEGGLPLWNIWLVFKRLEDYKKQGLLHLLIPSPTKTFDIDKVEKYMRHIEEEWEVERAKRSDGFQYSRVFPFTKLPLNAKIWTYEVIKGYRAEMEKIKKEKEVDVNGAIADYYGYGA